MQANTKPVSQVMARPAAAGPADGAAPLVRLAALAEELSAKRVADEARDLAVRFGRPLLRRLYWPVQTRQVNAN